jgi:hypothetical protein
LNSAAPGISKASLCNGKVTKRKQGKFFRSLCENLKTNMITTKAAHCSKNGSTKGESKYIKLIKCLEALDETKWPTDSDICFGKDPIKTLGKFFNDTGNRSTKNSSFSLCVIHRINHSTKRLK